VTFDLARDGDRRVEVLYPETADRFLPTRLPGPVSFAAARHLAPRWRAAQPLLVLAMVVVPWFWVAFTVLTTVIAVVAFGEFLFGRALLPAMAAMTWWAVFGGTRGRRLTVRPGEWGKRVALAGALQVLYVMPTTEDWEFTTPWVGMGTMLGVAVVLLGLQVLLVWSARRRLGLDDPSVGGSPFVLRRRLRKPVVGTVELRSDQVTWRVPLPGQEKPLTGGVPLDKVARVSYQQVAPHKVGKPWIRRRGGKPAPLPEGVVLRLELTNGRIQLVPVEDAPVLAAAIAQRVLLRRSLSGSR